MISFSLDYPTAWSASVGQAIGGWPSSFAPWADDGRTTAPNIRAWFGDAAVPGGLPVPTGPGQVASMVIGRSPMTAPRVSSWLRRVAMQVAAEDDLIAVTAWDLSETTHHFDLPHDTAASKIARTRVREVVGSFDRIDDVMLAASELAANAVQHGGGPVDLHVHAGADAVTIEIGDTNIERYPEVRRLPVFSVSGRGMSIVDSIAEHWGVTVRPSAKSVWCEFLR